ncbi:MAG TPA: hypothetical protein GX703_05465 [Erysipelothrix sp.]|jgi:hypothetical protein|nr:hypothetical protein [Erysipelothrix sp.]
MAKYETTLHGDLHSYIDFLENNLSRLGTSISLEESSVYRLGDVNVAIYVLERYSYFGSNRVSLNITLVEYQNSIKCTAITSGGSQAVFFKINTFGEEAFLDKFVDLINSY